MTMPVAENQIETEVAADAAAGLQRRRLLRRFGAGMASAAAVSALSAGGIVAGSRPARAAISDADVFNFALNLEYLEAEFYLRAVTGSGLSSSLTSGTGTQGSVTGGTLVPFQTAAVAYYAQRIANDELAHVRFIRDVLGSSSVAEPTIDLETSFTTLAVAAGLISSGQTFNPFASEIDFLVGAYIFEDVGVTAYAGAANVLTNADNIAYAASILGTEAYHAGAIRARLSEIGGGTATDAISTLRQKLGTVGDLGTNADGNPYNITNVDINGLVQRRSPQEVLSIVYGGGTNSGLFFPNGMNGSIAVA
jgi:hypothetical protein